MCLRYTEETSCPDKGHSVIHCTSKIELGSLCPADGGSVIESREKNVFFRAPRALRMAGFAVACAACAGRAPLEAERRPADGGETGGADARSDQAVSPGDAIAD